jgi:hypothetical protein
METEIGFSINDAFSDALIANQFAGSDKLIFSQTAPDDEEDEDEYEDDTDAGGDQSSDDDPPLDKEVVHSPVTTQPGGRPK